MTRPIRSFGIAFLLAAVTLLPEAARACHCGVWSISNSSIHHGHNVALPVGGPINLYLWLYRVPFEGVQTADLGLTGTVTPTQFTPEPGFSNSGTASSLELQLDLCDFGLPRLIGTIACTEPIEGGRLCIGPSDGGVLDFRSCPPPHDHPAIVGWVGFASDGEDRCEGENGFATCGVDPVDPATWGLIKSSYRAPRHPAP